MGKSQSAGRTAQAYQTRTQRGVLKWPHELSRPCLYSTATAAKGPAALLTSLLPCAMAFRQAVNICKRLGQGPGGL